MKLKKCKFCKQEFMPIRPLQSLCGQFDCTIGHANILKQRREASERKNERKLIRETREKQKTLTAWLDDTQDWVNRYVRLLAKKNGEGCISCGTRNPNIQYCAGHLRTRKAASHLRFNLDNIAYQCNHHCNQRLSGNILEFEKNLRLKIGNIRVDAIKNDNSIKRWTIPECQELIALYKQKCKELEK